jgi:hypothetical protein
MPIKYSQTLFSKLSILCALITTSLFVYLFIRTAEMFDSGQIDLNPPRGPMNAIMIFGLTGVVLTVLSFRKQEPATWFKWVGAVLNLFIAFSWVAMVIFAMVIDYNRSSSF